MTLRRRVAGLLSRIGTSTTTTTPRTPTAATPPGEGTYAPERDGEPDPGEVVWAWVPYEDDPSRGKDRPVLVIDTAGAGEHDGWVGLMLTSQDHDRDAADEARWGRHWMDVGTGGWDVRGRPSEVRLNRLIPLERGGVRREGAALDETIFTAVLAARRGLSR